MPMRANSSLAGTRRPTSSPWWSTAMLSRASSHASPYRACLSAGERSAGTDLPIVTLPTTREASKDTRDEVGNRAHNGAAMVGIRHVGFWPRQIADTCADTAYLLRDERPRDECARADQRHGEGRYVMTYNGDCEAIAGPSAAERAKNMRAGCAYGLTTAAYNSSLRHPRVCGRPKLQGFHCQDWTFSGQKGRWGHFPRINLEFRLHCIHRSLTNTLHSIALHLEHPDLSALPVHLRVPATFSYSALIKRTSSPT